MNKIYVKVPVVIDNSVYNDSGTELIKASTEEVITPAYIDFSQVESFRPSISYNLNLEEYTVIKLYNGSLYCLAVRPKDFEDLFFTITKTNRDTSYYKKTTI